MPATPTPNNGVDVSVQHPGPFSTVCEIRDEDEYAEVISQILTSPDIPNVPTEYVKRDLLKLFKGGCIACDTTLAACEEAILPKVVPLSDEPDWDKVDTLTVFSVHNRLKRLVEGVGHLMVVGLYLTERVATTDVLKFMVRRREIANTMQIGRHSSASTSSPTRSIDKIPTLELPEFSGQTIDFPDWSEAVELEFRSRGVQKYLTDDNHCSTHPEHSDAFTGALMKSLQNSVISAKARTLQGKSCMKFFEAISALFDTATARDISQYNDWCKLFQITLQSTDKAQEFKNQIEHITQRLQDRNAKGLSDSPLMRALITRGVSCDDLDTLMIGVRQNPNWDYTKILEQIVEHSEALAQKMIIQRTSSGALSPTHRSRRGNKKPASQAHKDKVWRIPPFPSNIRDFFKENQVDMLNKWRMNLNRIKDPNNHIEKSYTFRANPNQQVEESGGGGRRRRGNDRGRGGGRNNYRHNDSHGKYRGSHRSRRSKRSASRSRSRSRSSSRERSVSPPRERTSRRSRFEDSDNEEDHSQARSAGSRSQSGAQSESRSSSSKRYT